MEKLSLSEMLNVSDWSLFGSMKWQASKLSSIQFCQFIGSFARGIQSLRGA